MAGLEEDSLGWDFNPVRFITNFLIDHPASKPEEMSDVRLHNTIAREGFDILANLAEDLPPHIWLPVADKAIRQKESIALVNNEWDLKGIRALLKIELTTVLGMTDPPKKDRFDELVEWEAWKEALTGFDQEEEAETGDLWPIHRKIWNIVWIVDHIGERLNNPDREFNLTGVHKLVWRLKDRAKEPVDRQPKKK